VIHSITAPASASSLSAKWRNGQTLTMTILRVLDVLFGGALDATLEHVRAQPLAQLVGVEPALDLAVGHQRNLTRLLRHDDRERVVFLRQPDRGAMTGSELFAQLRIDGQRQEARGGGDA